MTEKSDKETNFMTEKISLALVSEAGEIVLLEKTTDAQLEIKIDVAIADMFSQICFRNNSISDAETKVAGKFHLARNLQNHLEEMKNYAD